MRALIIDDYEGDLKLCERALHRSGAFAAIAMRSSAYDALELIHGDAGNAPDVVFVDLNMPEMTGLEFLMFHEDLQRRSGAKPHLVVLTGDDRKLAPEVVANLPSLGAQLQKPLTQREIRDVANQLQRVERKSARHDRGDSAAR
ncbi:MAG: response regulator [Myxococcota bacterium]